MQQEQELIIQAKAGDLAAFQALVELYSHKVYAAAYRILNDKERAEDCAQEVFIKLYQKIGNFHEKSRFSTWVYSVATNTAIDIHRKYAKDRLHDEGDFEQMAASEKSQAENAVWMANLSKLTQKALLSLGEDLRIAFLLRHHEERSIEEISEILQLNPNTVKNRIFRAVAKLKEILQPEVGDYETVD